MARVEGGIVLGHDAPRPQMISIQFDSCLAEWLLYLLPLVYYKWVIPLTYTYVAYKDEFRSSRIDGAVNEIYNDAKSHQKDIHGLWWLKVSWFCVTDKNVALCQKYPARSSPVSANSIQKAVLGLHRSSCLFIDGQTFHLQIFVLCN